MLIMWEVESKSRKITSLVDKFRNCVRNLVVAKVESDDVVLSFSECRIADLCKLFLHLISLLPVQGWGKVIMH